MRFNGARFIVKFVLYTPFYLLHDVQLIFFAAAFVMAGFGLLILVAVLIDQLKNRKTGAASS